MVAPGDRNGYFGRLSASASTAPFTSIFPIFTLAP
jgi:hypothetical protein